MSDEIPIEQVVGHWHKLGAKTRCDYCLKITDYVFMVYDGPTTGKFCSKQHFLNAYEHMHKKKEKKENEEDIYKIS